MKIGKCLLVPPEEFSGEQKRRDQGQRSMENALWPPPEEISDGQKLRGLAATLAFGYRPDVHHVSCTWYEVL